MNLSVDLAPQNGSGLRLKNPVMTASGTFGYGTEYAKLVDIQRLGAIICKGTTLRPRKGNPQPRIMETPAGMLNSIGLENIGVEALVKQKAPQWANWAVPVIVNIAGDSWEDYVRLAELLSGVPGVAGIEVNISCPNVDAGGMEFGCDPRMAAGVTAAVRERCDLPLIVKLTPNSTDIVAVAEAVEAAGADAVSLINTIVGMRIDVRRRRPVFAKRFAGLSGPAIMPIALAMVFKVAGAVKIPVIACGGIGTAEDALEFILAGASAVQVGTASFVDPGASIAVIEGIERYLSVEGLDNLDQIIGAAQL
ncbi:MAG: dihydroorotate dehydrogenase [Dehalococcoidia bacterium]|nr:dihydroorotate dehydrogenase [Dehalococcoidia bacterium]